MSACPLPTDSILRRHFEQIASSVDLPPAPQDSVLLRHYRQLLDARQRPHTKPHTTVAPNPQATRREEASASAMPDSTPAAPAMAPSPRASHPEAPTSWFGRMLSRLFGN